jgi:hypothetical protein
VLLFSLFDFDFGLDLSLVHWLCFCQSHLFSLFLGSPPISFSSSGSSLSVPAPISEPPGVLLLCVFRVWNCETLLCSPAIPSSRSSVSAAVFRLWSWRGHRFSSSTRWLQPGAIDLQCSSVLSVFALGFESPVFCLHGFCHRSQPSFHAPVLSSKLISSATCFGLL